MKKSFASAMALGVLLSVAFVPTTQAQAPCDQASETCVLTAEPFVPAQLITFTTPAAANRSVANVYQMSSGQGQDLWATLVSAGEPGQYDTWQFVIEPRYDTGEVDLRLSYVVTGGFQTNHWSQPQVRKPASGLKATATKSQGKFSGTAQKDVKATVTATLQGKRSSGGWKTLDKAKRTERFDAREFSVETGRVQRSKCGGYEACRLLVKGTVYTQAEPQPRWYKSGTAKDSQSIR